MNDHRSWTEKRSNWKSTLYFAQNFSITITDINTNQITICVSIIAFKNKTKGISVTDYKEGTSFVFY